jgi:cardiolipin synthase
MDFMRRAAAIAAVAGLALAGACVSAPSIDRHLENTPATPVQVSTPHGVLTHAQSRRILDELRKRSPQGTVLDRHLAIEQTLAGTPLSAGNRATLLQDGAQTYPAELAAIRSAKSYIHLEMYIFEGGEVGREFADALVERRRAGVEVRVLYDGVGSMDTPKEFFDGLRHEGIEVTAFNDVSPKGVLRKGPNLDHRDHRKLIVVDGRVAFVGGINISHVYGPSPRGPGGSPPSAGSGSSKGSGKEEAKGGIESRPWRDTQVRIEGPVVAQLERTFLEQWAKQRKEAVQEDARYFPKVAPAGDELVRAIAGTPDEGVDAAYVALVSAIENSESAVRIMNAYFVPAKDLREALVGAARRGVRVELILPAHLDTWVVLEAGRSFYTELLEAGVHIYERGERLMHAKTATIDGVWSTVGSTNLDYRSLAHNDELNVVVLGPKFASHMEAAFAADIRHSKAITLEAWRDRGISARLKEAAARIWAYLL